MKIIYMLSVFYFSLSLPLTSSFKSDSDAENKANKIKAKRNSVNKGYCDIFSNSYISQDSPIILDYIRQFHLSPPSGRPFAPRKKDNRPGDYRPQISKLFANKVNGYFIEAGAHNGEYRSNTLDLERNQNWTGLLIEPNPFPLIDLRMKNRNAWISGVCLSLSENPERVRFMHPLSAKKSGTGIIENFKSKRLPPNESKRAFSKEYIYAGPVECFPLFSIMSAVNKTTVNFLSLDVRGGELQVLRAIPFDKVKIKTMIIGHSLIPEKTDSLLKFMELNKYKLLFKGKRDIIVVHKDYVHELNTNTSTRK